MVFFMRRLGYRREILQSDGEPSVTAFKNCDLFGSSICRNEGPVGEHATNGVAESAMREVKRQTRMLKFALEDHVERSSSHIASGGEYQRWHQMRSVSSGLAETA